MFLTTGFDDVASEAAHNTWFPTGISRWTNGGGEGGGGKDSPERGTTTALRELLSGEGRRGVAEAGVGKKELGVTLL